MNHQDIIDYKLGQLSGEHQQPMNKAMQNYLQQHPELQDELTFIEQFWLDGNDAPEQPSEKVSANFYRMLSQAQSVQSAQQALAQPVEQVSLLTKLSEWFAFRPMAQFASLAAVFALGVNLNVASVSNEGNNTGIANLQQEVSSLSTMVAVSMLQKSSASERLTGVAYSRQSNMNDPVLSATLIELLEKDSSTAVRLAIINAIANDNLAVDDPQLIQIAVNETNPLVQMELCRLLLTQGSMHTQNQLLKQLNNETLNQDVKTFIDNLQPTSHI